MAIFKKIKIMVGIDLDGNWCAGGWSEANEDDLKDMVADNIGYGENYFWVTAEVEIPEIKEVDADSVKQID
jgi:hypothetical protein